MNKDTASTTLRITDSFSASLLSVSAQGRVNAELADDTIDRIARRVVGLLSEQTTRNYKSGEDPLDEYKL